MADSLDSLADEVIEVAPPVSPVATREDEPDADGATGDERSANAAAAPASDPASGGATGGTVEIPVANAPFGTVTGEIFDATIHRVDADGNPVKNVDGTFQKKRGRKPGSSSGQSRATVTTTVLDTDSEKLRKATTSARAVVSTLFVLGNLIGGEEWSPIVNEAQGLNEPASLTGAYTEWFLTMDNVDVPPWIGAAICTAAYVIPRIQQPKTSSRLLAFWDWLKSLFTSSEKQGET